MTVHLASEILRVIFQEVVIWVWNYGMRIFFLLEQFKVKLSSFVCLVVSKFPSTHFTNCSNMHSCECISLTLTMSQRLLLAFSFQLNKNVTGGKKKSLFPPCFLTANCFKVEIFP